jgi:cellulose synthase/poly-beta-1,6-N-acetylglucosamine synthase-like glycosyltransferase
MLDLPFEPYWTLILLLFGLFYLTALSWIRRGLTRLPNLCKEAKTPEDLPSVSIIIPCKDEGEHIGAALDDLAGQDYPQERCQIIVIDDRSVDSTGDVARSKTGQFTNLTVLTIESCPPDVSPKKHAIQQGLKEATGEILVTTDGDCRFKPGWISSLISCFSMDVGVVTGLTVFDRDRKEPFWQKMQQTDYLSHSFFAAGAIANDAAFNCNGSNLAIRREAFEAIGGYDQFQQVVTGDDTLLIQHIRRDGKWKIHFCTYPDSVVRSWPEETPRQVFNQRLRWGSGGFSYSPVVLAFTLATFIFFILLFLSPIFWIAGSVTLLWVAFFLLKVIQEGRVMAAGWKIFSIKPDWSVFVALELVHIPAVLTFSILGHLYGFRWKGQRLKRARSVSCNVSKAAT